MTDETLGESPATDVVETDSSTETVVAETTPADTGAKEASEKDAVQRRIDKLT